MCLRRGFIVVGGCSFFSAFFRTIWARCSTVHRRAPVRPARYTVTNPTRRNFSHYCPLRAREPMGIPRGSMMTFAKTSPPCKYWIQAVLFPHVDIHKKAHPLSSFARYLSMSAYTQPSTNLINVSHGANALDAISTYIPSQSSKRVLQAWRELILPWRT